MLKRNLLANYCGTGFVALTQVMLIPLYVRFLGEEQWGVLSAVIALSTTLLVLEGGVSQAVARSFTALSSEKRTASDRLRWIERRYLLVVVALGVLALAASPWVSRALLPKEAASPLSLFTLTVLMAVAQIMCSLYRAALMGSGGQVRFNAVLIAFTALRHTSAILAAFWGGAALGVAAAFAFGFVLEACARRWVARGYLKRVPPSAPISVGTPIETMGALPLAIAGASGALMTQIDRVVLTHVVDAKSLGHYTIAATLSLATLQLVYPFTSALIPRLDLFRSAADRNAITRRSYMTIGGILLVVWAAAIFMSLSGLRMWLGGTKLALSVAPLYLFHLVGTTLNALGVPLYLGLLAHRRDRGIAAINLTALFVLTTAILALSPIFGIVAGSLAWCAANACICVGYYFLLRYWKKSKCC
jgi:O-antigen/teichoic acid export membrane protein